MYLLFILSDMLQENVAPSITFFQYFCKPPDEFPGKTELLLRKTYIQTFLIFSKLLMYKSYDKIKLERLHSFVKRLAFNNAI